MYVKIFQKYFWIFLPDLTAFSFFPAFLWESNRYRGKAIAINYAPMALLTVGARVRESQNDGEE